MILSILYSRAAAPAADPGKECEEAEGGPRQRRTKKHQNCAQKLLNVTSETQRKP